MIHQLDAIVCRGIEADDQMAMDQTEDTIICSRDKDLKQVPGWLYSWELGRQPAFGPEEIDQVGYLSLSDNRKKVAGTGLSFFYAQCLMGDTVDNIPGLPGCGPVRTYEILEGMTDPEEMEGAVLDAYCDQYGLDAYKYELLEQGRLLWMTRAMTPENTPVLWEIGMRG